MPRVEHLRQIHFYNDFRDKDSPLRIEMMRTRYLINSYHPWIKKLALTLSLTLTNSISQGKPLNLLVSCSFFCLP